MNSRTSSAFIEFIESVTIPWMPTPGRNDPCPCGSGRKYKVCCLRAGDALDAVRARLRDAEARLMPRLLELTAGKWGNDGFQEAIDRFYADAPFQDPIVEDREFESLFCTWLVLCFVPERALEREGLPAALIYLDETSGVTEFDRRYLSTAFESPVSFHAVLSVVPGRSMDLEDILTGETCQVLERTASQSVRAGGVLFGRVLSMDGVSILFGMGSTQLPPTRRSDLIPLRDGLAGRGKRLTRDGVAVLDDLLRHWYLQAADQEHNPQPPTLMNTDGEPLVLTTLTFELRCEPDEAFTALRPLNAIVGAERDLLEDAERDAAGHLVAFTIDWLKRGNKKHAHWDNTLLASIAVRGSSMTVEVNSNRRAARVKREVAKRLGSRAAFVRGVIRSTEAMLKEMKARGPRIEDPLSSPELEAVAAEMQERHWDAWVNQKVPALGNRTPRQAARSAAGREMLNALLAEFEWRGDAPVDRLRAKLKM